MRIAIRKGFEFSAAFQPFSSRNHLNMLAFILEDRKEGLELLEADF